MNGDKLEYLYNLRPNGLSYDASSIAKRVNGKLVYYFPKWMSGKTEDEWISLKMLNKSLKLLGIDNQEYHDVMVLSISDSKDRPKCPCGTYTRYCSPTIGYRKYCSMDCQIKFNLKGRKQSEETIRKRSEGMKGKKNALGYHHTEKAKMAMSKARKGVPHSDIWKLNSSIAASLRYERMPEKMPSYNNSKRGKYYSEKFQYEFTYQSSWELYFIKECDTIDRIKVLKRGYNYITKYVDPISNKIRRYEPDFEVILDDGSVIVVEIKPYNLVSDSVVTSKRNAILNRINNENLSIKYITLTEIELYNSELPLIDYILGDNIYK